MSAYSEGHHEVTVKHVKTAAIDSDFASKFDWKPYAYSGFAVASLVVAVWLGVQLQSFSSEGVLAENASSETAVGKVAQLAVEPAGHPAMVDSRREDEAGANLLTTRLGDTRDWFLQVPDNHYSIQLFMARTVDAKAIEQFLQDVQETLDFEKIYIYETVVNGRPMYSVLYDEYSTRQTARTTLKQLPADLQASKPYLRRVSALRKDMVVNG